jgi:hypothetical protein
MSEPLRVDPVPEYPDPTPVIQEAWTAHTRFLKPPWTMEPRDYCWASGYQDCVRSMALDLTNPEDRGDFPDEVLERLARGDDAEASMVARLSLAGQRSGLFSVDGQQDRFQLNDRQGNKVLTGKMDGRITFRDFPQYHPPFEIKSGSAVSRVECFDDLLGGKWTKKYLTQILIYLLGKGEPLGYLILDQFTGPLFIPVWLEENLDLAERFFEQATAASAFARKDGPLPEFTHDLSLCQTCHHRGKSCAPPTDFGEGLVVIDDPELLEAARIREEYAEWHAQYKRADKLIKTKLRGVPLATIGGEFRSEGKFEERKEYKVPDKVKQKYLSINKEAVWKMKIIPTGDPHQTTDPANPEG